MHDMKNTPAEDKEYHSRCIFIIKGAVVTDMAESPFEAGSEAVALAVTGFAGDHFTVVFHCIGRRVSHICIEELMKCRDIGR